MCNKHKNEGQEVNIAVHLETKEQADIFFQQTGIIDPSCACTNYGSYGHETAYHIGYEEFGNVRMYQSHLYRKGSTVVLSFDQFMYLRGMTLANEYEVPQLLDYSEEEPQTIYVEAELAAKEFQLN